MIADAEQAPNNGPVRVSITDDEFDFRTKTTKAIVIDCIAWGQTAQTLLNYAGAGAIISGTGKISSRDYTDQRTGNTRRFQDLVLTEVRIHDNPGQATGRQPGYSLIPQATDPTDQTSW